MDEAGPPLPQTLAWQYLRMVAQMMSPSRGMDADPDRRHWAGLMRWLWAVEGADGPGLRMCIELTDLAAFSPDQREYLSDLLLLLLDHLALAPLYAPHLGEEAGHRRQQ